MGGPFIYLNYIQIKTSGEIYVECDYWKVLYKGYLKPSI